MAVRRREFVSVRLICTQFIFYKTISQATTNTNEYIILVSLWASVSEMQTSEHVMITRVIKLLLGPELLTLHSVYLMISDTHSR